MAILWAPAVAGAAGVAAAAAASATRRRIGRNGVAAAAVDEGGGKRRRQRLLDLVGRVPGAATNYFRSPWRRALFGGISLLGGFFVAQTISLSFGAVGVNDVIASALCVLLTEYMTRFYFTRQRPSLGVALLNNFKMGFTYGLFIDAFKLAS
ncbi:uncharacterized protein LOC9647309 [Selaginella moellendorffii]|uniref:uncharacterized protein LOC9647309 n=1 Tax=Selaginella moellendorffii TaxID=88036 RepID=UPI000D1CAE61|nr:uncharacterized protein LOC9647309 [Selaginella moellendorffii]|eukprot:XP_002990137.2 uncharacterized protein LOC9647309 [Selaginella moellendorffii]